ncbi:hypothetical protein QBC47DRAFT_407907 [Echria macrotheca]|uniref:Uncharacterized protein n=1 Tax=Echria macrotheca TaxID=438768 RepID=A0AAJ0B0R6_9PEZI|nr:hypothetical protein QBC47DRAFT_407907 [Echria macrotheca]
MTPNQILNDSRVRGRPLLTVIPDAAFPPSSQGPSTNPGPVCQDSRPRIDHEEELRLKIQNEKARNAALLKEISGLKADRFRVAAERDDLAERLAQTEEQYGQQVKATLDKATQTEPGKNMLKFLSPDDGLSAPRHFWDGYPNLAEAVNPSKDVLDLDSTPDSNPVDIPIYPAWYNRPAIRQHASVWPYSAETVQFEAVKRVHSVAGVIVDQEKTDTRPTPSAGPRYDTNRPFHPGETSSRAREPTVEALQEKVKQLTKATANVEMVADEQYRCASDLAEKEAGLRHVVAGLSKENRRLTELVENLEGRLRRNNQAWVEMLFRRLQTELGNPRVIAVDHRSHRSQGLELEVDLMVRAPLHSVSSACLVHLATPFTHSKRYTDCWAGMFHDSLQILLDEAANLNHSRVDVGLTQTKGSTSSPADDVKVSDSTYKRIPLDQDNLKCFSEAFAESLAEEHGGSSSCVLSHQKLITCIAYIERPKTRDKMQRPRRNMQPSRSVLCLVYAIVDPEQIGPVLASASSLAPFTSDGAKWQVVEKLLNAFGSGMQLTLQALKSVDRRPLVGFCPLSTSPCDGDWKDLVSLLQRVGRE